ncbi:metallophosphoesterase [Thioalkalivibrio sp. XN279]|uniref:metallophosphoesterase n=1 Tax=Thioalkalivibrio sp. XN279 TaxID=2714953 RepID=UPI00140B69B1|nr:metallophosphoesterase [Thioalkalivibrio sp. XN279]NHA16116.1 phosphodiesterase [Thioalkalivibrio sp. XN279]
MGAERPVRLLQLTDSHVRAAADGELKGWRTLESLEATLAAALDGQDPPDAILATGDLSQDGSRESYRHIRRVLAGAGVPVYCIPGNHDHPPTMMAELSSAPFHYCGDVGLGAWRLVMLSTWDGDRGGGRLSPQELQRLAGVLDRSREPHLLMVLHHHPVPVGSWLDKVGLDNADEFMRLADGDGRIRGIVWGHVHQVFERQRRGMQLLAAPSTCFQFKRGAPTSDVDATRGPGFRWLELLPDGRISTRVGWVPVPVEAVS